MKVLTLHQPWASLVAMKVKTIETRSWKPPAAMIGQRLLIHAGAKAVAVRHSHQIGEWRTYGADGALTTSPRPARMYPRSIGWAKRPEEAVVLPFGAIVASCILADAVPMVGPNTHAHHRTEPHAGERRLFVMPDELVLTRVESGPPHDVTGQRPYGDFAPGRWAYLLTDIEALPKPIPCRGAQRFWTPPPEVLACLG